MRTRGLRVNAQARQRLGHVDCGGLHLSRLQHSRGVFLLVGLGCQVGQRASGQRQALRRLLSELQQGVKGAAGVTRLRFQGR